MTPSSNLMRLIAKVMIHWVTATIVLRITPSITQNVSLTAPQILSAQRRSIVGVILPVGLGIARSVFWIQIVLSRVVKLHV